MSFLERFGKSGIIAEGAECHSEPESLRNPPATNPSWQDLESDFEELALKHNLAEEPNTNVVEVLTESLSNLHTKGIEGNERQLEAKAETAAKFSIGSLQLKDKGRKNQSGDGFSVDSNEPFEMTTNRCRTVTPVGLCAGRSRQCANFVVREGRYLKCSRRCSFRLEKFANYPVRGESCIKHGTMTPICSHGVCTINAKQGGLCLRHGAKLKICAHEGCTKIAPYKGGVCWNHTAMDVASFAQLKLHEL